MDARYHQKDKKSHVLFARLFKELQEPACQACGFRPFSRFAKRILEVHHITRVVDGGAHSAENALLLCANCHALAHGLFSTSARCRVPETKEDIIVALRDPGGFLAQEYERAAELVNNLRPR